MATTGTERVKPKKDEITLKTPMPVGPDNRIISLNGATHIVEFFKEGANPELYCYCGQVPISVEDVFTIRKEGAEVSCVECLSVSASKAPDASEYKMLYNCVLIEPEDKVLNLGRDNAIIKIPDALKKKPMTGVVVSVGSGRPLPEGKFLPLQVKEGDRVLFDRYAGLPFIFGQYPNAIERYVVQETQIFMIVPPKEIITSVTK